MVSADKGPHGLNTVQTSLPDPVPIVEGDVAPGMPIDACDEKNDRRRTDPVLQDQTNLLPLGKLLLVMLGLNCAAITAVLDSTIVATIIPVLGRELGRADIGAWVGSSYLLTSTAFLPLYGRLSDIFGNSASKQRKYCLLLGLSIFLVGSVLCATARTMIDLIIFRALAGIGGGGIINMVFIILSDLVTLKDRGKYQGLLTVAQIMAGSLGPLIGGAFSTSVSWRWCFYINIPLTALAILSVILFVPRTKITGGVKAKLKQIDYLGSILTLAWTCLVLIALQWGGTQYSWTSAATLVPLLIGLSLLAAFIVVEAKQAKLPIIPMGIFRKITVCSGLATTFIGAVILYGNLYYLPQFFQVVRGDSPIRAGVLLLPTITVNSCSVFVAGFIVSHTGKYRAITYLGFAVTAIGQGLLSTIDKDTPTARIIGFQILSSVGNGMTPQTLLVAIQAAVERKDMAVASATRNFMRQLGGTIAITICSTILNNSLRTHLEQDGVDSITIGNILNDPTSLATIGVTQDVQDQAIEGFTRGIRNVFYLCSACAASSSILVFFFLRSYDLTRKDDAERKATAKLRIKNKKATKQGATDVEALSAGDGPLELATAHPQPGLPRPEKT